MKIISGILVIFTVALFVLGYIFPGVFFGIITIITIVAVYGENKDEKQLDSQRVKIPFSTNFDWRKADEQFREIHLVLKKIHAFCIESEGEFTLARLFGSYHFDNSTNTGYITVALGFYIDDNGFGIRHGKYQNHYGDNIVIPAPWENHNEKIVNDYLYYGLDVKVELGNSKMPVSNSNIGQLIICTNIPTTAPKDEVKRHFEMAKRYY